MKKIELNTHDLQRTILALICNDSCVLRDNPNETEKLINLYGELNKLCVMGNNYTITLRVKA